MKSARTKFALCAAAALAIIAIPGCPSADSRTSNQGGGTILSAGTKVAGNQIATLTPDEIQILYDLAASRTPKLDGYDLTDEQAAAAAEFLKLNEVNSPADIDRLVKQYEADPSSIEFPAALLALAGSGGFAVD